MNKFLQCVFVFLSIYSAAVAQQTVKFVVKKTTAFKRGQSLFIAGDFNNWDPADKKWRLKLIAGGAYTTANLLSAGIHNFKITRGSWQTVECNSAGKSINNRKFNLINDTTITMEVEGWQDKNQEGEQEHTATAQVHVISDHFDMPQLGRQRRIWIYLPEGYDHSESKYPVIYMQDGQNLFDNATAAFGEWGVDEIMDNLKDHKQCIIVAIDNGGDFRITEYDPYDSKFGQGRGDDYTKFMVETLKPYIDTHYRTETEPKFTTVAGSSMGGLIAMYAALKYPDVFGNAGIFSPAFWLAPDIYDFAQQQQLPQSSRFYFVCGDAESETMVADVEKMAAIVRTNISNEQQVSLTIVNGAEHNEAQWSADYPAFYKWLTEQPGM